MDLLAPWAEALAPRGWLGLQVPGNFGAPSHVLMHEAAVGHPREGAIRAALRRPRSDEPQDYLRALLATGLTVDAWETTYPHVLDAAGTREHPVLDWVSGTGLRPVLQALADEGARAAYVQRYAALLGAAYPRTPSGVVLPFRRIFAVGRKGAS